MQQSNDCQLYGKEQQSWPSIKNGTELNRGEWVFYLADRYFGQVVETNSQQVVIQVTHFRTKDSRYQATLSAKELVHLRRRPSYVLVDPEIHEQAPGVYQALEKAFAIWKKIDGAIMTATHQGYEFTQLLPRGIQEAGAAFGTWAASGYITKEDLQQLRSGDFVSLMKYWKAVEELAWEQTVPEELLIALDKIVDYSWQQAQKSTFPLPDYLALQAGFFFDDKENRQLAILAASKPL